jgi:radical SAM protein with 4Fe4S-binding SPASM domain
MEDWTVEMEATINAEIPGGSAATAVIEEQVEKDTRAKETSVLVSPDVIVERRGKESLLICPQMGRWFRTSELGEWFVNRCDGQRTLGSIYQELAQDKGMLSEQAEMILGPFITSTLGQGFVQEGEKYVYPSVVPPEDFALDGGLGSIWIHGTLRCNLNCFFCYSSSGDRAGPELSSEDIAHLMAQIPCPEQVGFQISGGEPFLWSDLVGSLRAIKEANGGRITLLTNGTVGTTAEYEAVIPYVDQIQFSIDGASSETHDRHRGKGAFEAAMSRIETAKELGVKSFNLSFTPSRHNIEDLPAVFTLARELGAFSLHVNRLMPVGRGKLTRPENAAPDEVYVNVMDQLVSEYRAYIQEEVLQQRINSLKIGYDPSQKTPLIGLDIAGDQSRKVVISSCRTTCGTATMLSLDADGSVYSCPSLHLPELRLGNLREDTLEEMWKARRPFLQQTAVDALPTCKDCDHRYICGGGCRALAYAHTGSLSGQDALCEQMKQAIISCMWALKVV